MLHLDVGCATTPEGSQPGFISTSERQGTSSVECTINHIGKAFRIIIANFSGHYWIKNQ